MVTMGHMLADKGMCFFPYFGCLGGGEEWGEGIIRECVMHMYDQQGPTVQHRELSSMLCGSLEGRRVWERMHPCICTPESLCCPLETITTLLIGYTPTQNNRFIKKQSKITFNHLVNHL